MNPPNYEELQLLAVVASAAILWTFLLLQVKHLIIDWVWQPAFEHTNKHIYGHWGGVRHALKNAIGTGICLYVGFLGSLTPLQALSLAAIDFVVHYHVDWSKMNINKRMGWGPTTHCQFWWLTGLDQFMHQLTYIILLVISVFLVY